MKRILFVDDESKILDGIRRMLYTQRSQWEMEFSLGGEAALKACEAGSFDVVVSDMRMPGMDGATLLGHIRDLYPNTARIILSGYSEAALAIRAVPVAHRFLAKPCNAADLQSTIDQLCTLQGILNSPDIRRIVGSIGELPSLSSTYLNLAEALRDPNTSISHVAQIIEEDVAMSAKVLQLVNSAFFGVAQKVTSLSGAATYLGMETMKNLALASEAFRVFVPGSRIPQSFCESIQRHAQRTAAIANALPLEKKMRETAVVAALLHDVGRLIISSAMPDQFCAVRALATERGCKFFEAEEELLGTTHAEIGAYLLGLWGIPNLAVEAIAHHHRPTRIAHTGLDCTIAVYVADLLADEMEAHPEGTKGMELGEYERECLEAMGVLPQLAEFREIARECFE
jgi:HD-like signal output (HDOD) protein